MTSKTFASDNYAGIHPEVLQALSQANVGHAKAYGDDTYTEEATRLLKKHFGSKSDPYLVATGTAANVLALSTMLKPYQAVIAAQSSHINVDECGALENYTGSKLLTISSDDGKLSPKSIEELLINLGDQHKAQPKVISISQTTEAGTLYTLDEIKEISQLAKKHHLYLHMDGARLSNAAAALHVSLEEMVRGVDVVCFGGTKNGMMLGEAVIFLNTTLSQEFKFVRKQGMQLLSKMRFVAAQFIALLKNDLWLKNAAHANAKAKLLESELKKIPYIKITKSVEANALFAILDRNLIRELQKKYYFYVWDEYLSEVRFMTAWDTTTDDIHMFVSSIKERSL